MLLIQLIHTFPYIYSFDPNPTIRHTIWSQIIGGLFYWLQTNAVSQNMIQRYLALPNLKAARKALWIFVIGVIIMMLLCSYNGLLIYATYKDCDPLTTKVKLNNINICRKSICHTIYVNFIVSTS